jgi:hypothetical protein
MRLMLIASDGLKDQGPLLATPGSHAYLVHCQWEQSISERETKMVVSVRGTAVGLTVPL